MSIARGRDPLPSILTDADWAFDFAFVGEDGVTPQPFPSGSTFSLSLAPRAVATPTAEQLFTPGGACSFTSHVVSVALTKAMVTDVAPGEYDLELRRTGPGTVFDPLVFARVRVVRGVSEASRGGAGATGISGGGSWTIVTGVQVIRSESAGAVALAAGYAQEASEAADDAAASAALIDYVATAVTPVVKTLVAGVAQNMFAATGTAEGRWMRNRGPGDATYTIDATASGAASELSLNAGERIDFPYRTGLRVSVRATDGAVIEGERWT